MYTVNICLLFELIYLVSVSHKIKESFKFFSIYIYIYIFRIFNPSSGGTEINQFNFQNAVVYIGAEGITIEKEFYLTK